jgi:Uma2 family endonuclease
MNQHVKVSGFTGLQPYRMSADDYLRIVDAGGFADAHVELYDGELVESHFTGTRPYRMTSEDYIRAIHAGAFGDAHVELVKGELVQMAPSGLEHGSSNADIVMDLGAIYRPLGYRIYVDTIVELSEGNIRAPDIAVVDKDTGDRKRLVPSDILLAVEIAGSTLVEDISRKRIDYASAGIRHYWVVDVEGRRVHCYADPQGADYSAILVVPFGEAVAVPGADGVIVVA